MKPLDIELDLTADPTSSQKHKTRVLLIALNVSGYYSLPIRTLSLLIHRSPGLAQHFDTRFIESDVDQTHQHLLAIIERWQPDIIGLSVNIWNRNDCIGLAKAIKNRHPQVVIIAGGQEVTGSVIDYLDQVPEFDYVVDGEGEIPFQQFLENWDRAAKRLRNPESVSGFRYRTPDGNYFTGPAQLVGSLDEIPSPILHGLVPIKIRQKLGVLLEASRCCPFRCSYCFEGSRSGGLRILSIKRLIQEIDFVVERGGSYFHIMDPILCMEDIERLRMLTDHIKKLSKGRSNIVFSVEAYAEHITAEVADCLRACSIIDVGLQSINPLTLKEIRRKYIPHKFNKGLKYLRQVGAAFNLYLICGLPHETLLTYLLGVVHIVNQKPTRVFFNELCLLNGTELRKRADEYGYRFSLDPPYQVYQTKWMNVEELKLAQASSKAIEKQYNLSLSAIYPKMPWARPGSAKNCDTQVCHIHGACSGRCTGCAIWNTSSPDDRHDLLYASVNQSDVEICTGDGADKNKLLQLLGQLHLAGVSRIKLRTPPRLLCDADFVELLIQRGVWHFVTFGSAHGDFRDDAADTAGRQLLSGLDNLDRVFALRGQAQLRPFVEVCVFPNGTDPGIIRPHVQRLVARNVSIINVPAHIQCSREDWMDALTHAFAAGLTSRCWLKMPEQIVRRALDGVDNINEIISIFHQLNLLSREMDHPPCYWGEETEEVSACEG